MSLEEELMQNAMDAGKKQAKKILKIREEALKYRAEILSNTNNRIELSSKFVTKVDDEFVKKYSFNFSPLSLSTFSKHQTAGVIIAEGDSWFDYPFYDVLTFLEDRHGYDVESVASKGDTIESMAYSDGQLNGLTRKIEKVLSKGIVPKAILISGGGNDVAGEQFGIFLNHINSKMPTLNDKILDGVMDRIKYSYITIISAVIAVCESKINKKIPILIHGYDYPVADGRGFLGGASVLPGPWFEPGFMEKGYNELQKRIEITKVLIDRLNNLLRADIANVSEFTDHVKYVNLVGVLSNKIPEEYKEDWGNELHPTARGFSKVAERFAMVLDEL